jgi:hypothetical protein
VAVPLSGLKQLAVPAVLGVLLVAGCGSAGINLPGVGSSPAASPVTPRASARASAPAAQAQPSGSPGSTTPPTSMSFPRHVGKYRLVTLKGHPAAKGTSDPKMMRFFPDAASAVQAAYMPGRNFGQAVVVTGGQIRPGVDPAAAINKYVLKVKDGTYGVTSVPAGPLGGQAKCWLFGGVVYCMWADTSTYAVFLYAPPTNSVAHPIQKMASEMLTFRHAMEQVRR